MKKDLNSQEWLSQLVAFDTTSRNSNLKLIQHIHQWFQELQIPCRLTYNEDKQKANILATLPDLNGNLKGGLVLSGHTDVVPVDGQTWDTDPFKLTLQNNRLYGRGSTDMKGFIAVVLALIPEWRQMKLNKPLHFAFSYDEEVGCHGAVRLIEDLVKQDIQPEACIVGEPTEMQPIVAHKGIHLYRCRIHGQAVHSSLTNQGCNAIDYAAQFICWLREFSDRLRQQGPFDKHFDVPYTSMSTNLIQGGNAFNTVPSFCEFFFECRSLPDIKPQTIAEPIKEYVQKDLLPKMQMEFANAKIEVDALASVPAFKATDQSDIAQLLQKLTNNQEIKKVAYATEAGLFQQAGIPTILCGPGNIVQAHRANEYIEVSQLNKCEELLRQVVKA